MCDRSKVEILARELCIERYAGMKASDNVVTDIETFTDKFWKRWEKQSIQLLETLEKHK